MLRSNDKGTNTFRKTTKESRKCFRKIKDKTSSATYLHFPTDYQSHNHGYKKRFICNLIVTASYLS